jgi:hypothetical protein
MSHILMPSGRHGVRHLPTGTPNQPTLRPKLAHCLRPEKGRRAEFVNIAGACLREECEFYPSDVSTAVLHRLIRFCRSQAQKQPIAFRAI